jgi:hypothetical protein
VSAGRCGQARTARRLAFALHSTMAVRASGLTRRGQKLSERAKLTVAVTNDVAVVDPTELKLTHYRRRTLLAGLSRYPYTLSAGRNPRPKPADVRQSCEAITR